MLSTPFRSSQNCAQSICTLHSGPKAVCTEASLTPPSCRPNSNLQQPLPLANPCSCPCSAIFMEPSAMRKQECKQSVFVLIKPSKQSVSLGIAYFFVTTLLLKLCCPTSHCEGQLFPPCQWETLKQLSSVWIFFIL